MTNAHTYADDLPMPFFVIEEDGQSISWANQAALEWTGRSLRRLQTKTLANLFNEFDAVYDAMERCRQDFGPVSLYDFIIKRSEKAAEKAHLTVFPAGDKIGLTCQISTRAPREGPPGHHAISAMGRMLAHEIKNPLAGIDGAAQLLIDDVNTKEGQALIDLIRSEINRIRRLADRMESLGDHDPKMVGPVNIHELLTKARLIVQSASPNSVQFIENYDTSLPSAIGDADTLLQAILNLIKNAAESLEGTRPDGTTGGTITLETSFRSGVTRRDNDDGSVRSLPIDIRIIDDGPGISDDLRSRLFQPFVTNKPAGQGLGLALVSKVAGAHGGLVELSSRPGHTVFSILLPTEQTPPLKG
ncbi:MAG: two-component system sensor histidine kinase NtrB [Alphaproteobacteria bacterium]